MSMLILVRHGESEGNARKIITGQLDVPLTPKGKQQAYAAAHQLQNIPVHVAFVSELLRAQETLTEMKEVLAGNMPTITSPSLNERNFGLLTGHSKLEVSEQMGEPAFRQMTKGWDITAPSGESLKDVYERVVSYFQTTVRPELLANRNVLLVSHHQTLRALIKYLDNISDADINMLRLANASATVYELRPDASLVRISF